ncbi:hypothetical protein CVS40_7315 [Lucilia cuprina]|nr:hypothetical protein CVS40_7315 [Lucilia cuprina]
MQVTVVVVCHLEIKCINQSLDMPCCKNYVFQELNYSYLPKLTVPERQQFSRFIVKNGSLVKNNGGVLFIWKHKNGFVPTYSGSFFLDEGLMFVPLILVHHLCCIRESSMEIYQQSLDVILYDTRLHYIQWSNDPLELGTENGYHKNCLIAYYPEQH